MQCSGGSEFPHSKLRLGNLVNCRWSSELDAHRDVSVDTRRTGISFCVKTVSHAPETLGGYRHLWGHAEADRCCGKSLIRSALVRFGVRQHARGESISKRAPSTTRISLRLESTTCEQSDRDYRTRLRVRSRSSIVFPFSRLQRRSAAFAGNCVRHANAARSLMAISLSWRRGWRPGPAVNSVRHSEVAYRLGDGNDCVTIVHCRFLSISTEED